MTGCVTGPVRDSSPPEIREESAPVPEKKERKIDIFRDRFTLGELFEKEISFSWREKSILEIVRNINTLTGIDIGVDPAVLKRVRNRRYTLSATELPLQILLNWCARLMECSYVKGKSPDIWLIREQDWMRTAEVRWDGYPSSMALLGGDEDSMLNLVSEFQKGLSWIRDDIQPVADPRRRLIMVNSTEQGHKRLKKTVAALSDRRFIQLEQIEIPGNGANRELEQRIVSCPNEYETLRGLIRRIYIQARLNVGWNSLLFGKEEGNRIYLPLPEYRVGDLLGKIIEFTPVRGYHWEGNNSLWLSHRDEPPFYSERYVGWESMNVYIIGIHNLVRKVRGSDIVKDIKQKVFPRLWDNPSSLIGYEEKPEILIIIQKKEVIEEILHYLISVEKFGRIQTTGQ